MYLPNNGSMLLYFTHFTGEGLNYHKVINTTDISYSVLTCCRDNLLSVIKENILRIT